MAQSPTNIEFQILKVGGNLQKLDIAQTTDFPLAITYSIKDVQDPQSSKGSFSKTFSIPATGHNNKVLVNLYSDSIYKAYQYLEEYQAQIFIDGMLVLQGSFNVKGTTTNNVPQSYECVVFGDNYKWVNALAELNLCDIDFSAGNFFPMAPTNATFGRSAMEDTWEFNQAGEIIGGVQTHIVYPLVNTGKWNYTTSSGKAIVTPSDMTPAFYFYNMIKCIFAGQGYNIESAFFETEWFKRLVAYIPKKAFNNSAEIIALYSFEYEDTGTDTAYKTPLNYNNQGATPNDCSGVPGNTWHGQMNDLSLVCPSCDPSSLITTQTIAPRFDVQSPLNIANADNNDIVSIAGWYWGNYGYEVGSPMRVPWLTNSPCNIGSQQFQYYVGLDFSCVGCDINSGTSNQSIPLSIKTFQTPFSGTYSFNASMELEMDNSYEILNPVAPYDTNIEEYMRGTGWGGNPPASDMASFECENGDDGGGGGEFWSTRYMGTSYVFNMFLIHYKASTGRYHIVSTQSERKHNPSPLSPYAPWYCETNPLSSSFPNLTANLEFSGVQLDILNADDKVFIYSEVTCEKNLRFDSEFAMTNDVFGLCQMKYRCTKQTFSGNLTPDLVNGGSISLSQLLPCKTKQLDWITGLTGLFNLFWQSDEATKTIRVEPRDMFFNAPDTALDWTAKLDHLTDHKNKYIYDALKRNLCFTYEKDSTDGFVEERNRRRGQKCELGSHSLNLGDLYVNEEQKIGSEFYAPSYMFYDKTISGNLGAYKQPFIPVIHGEYSEIWSVINNWELPEKVNDYAPRILTWYGLQPLNQTDGNISSNNWKWGYDFNSDPYESKTRYPFAGVYCDQDGTLGGSLNLASVTYNRPSLYFENSPINAVSVAPPYDYTNGLYDIFWGLNILSLLNRPKVKTVFFKLSATDIANLDFRELIYLEGKQSGTYWILNKIVDYKPGSNELTQVELYEYSNTRPLKPASLTEGFGDNVTDQWSDFEPAMVSFNTLKIPKDLLDSDLGIFSTTRTPILNQGTQSNSLPQKQGTATIIGKSKSRNYFDDGTRVPIGGGFSNSSNVGNNENVNVGSISIGNNQVLQNANQIVIGNGNNTKSLSNIEMTANGRTAFSIKSDGVFREGGGGVVYFEDASGDVREVMTGIPTIGHYGASTTFFYTRLTMNDQDIT